LSHKESGFRSEVELEGVRAVEECRSEAERWVLPLSRKSGKMNEMFEIRRWVE
jgi:hypothetical protein